MKYFYDCEFHENGKTIDLISIGIVSEDGKEYYAVSNEFDTRAVAKNDWLMNNVMSSIGHEEFIVADWEGAPVVRDIFVTDKNARSREVIAWDIHDIIKNDADAELWAWYSAYDHVCLAQLFGSMNNLPKRVPKYTSDIKTLHKRAGFCEMPKQSEGLHNALSDARFNLVRYNFLKDVLESKGCAI